MWLQDEKRNMLIYIADESSNNYKNVLKAASQLKSDCNWYVMSGPAAEPYRKDGEDVIYFRQPMVSNATPGVYKVVEFSLFRLHRLYSLL